MAKLVLLLASLAIINNANETNPFYGIYNITQYNYTFDYFNQSFDAMFDFWWNYGSENHWETMPDYWGVNLTDFNTSKAAVKKISYKYYEWVLEYNKYNNYFINISSNYLGMFKRIVQFIINDQSIDKLNKYKLHNITVYKKDENGSYTNEIDYIESAPPYNHTWFSDFLPDDMQHFLGAILEEENVNAAADGSCATLNDLPSSTSTRINYNNYCPSVGYQQYGDCWSWASTTQANCNYNQRARNTDSKFSKLYTDFCSGSGDVTSGGYPNAVAAYFVQEGACSLYKYPYPGPGGQKDYDQECQGCEDDLTRATACYILDSGSKSTDFKRAHYWVAQRGYAMSISLNVGESFNYIDSSKGKYPIDTVCSGDSLGGHAMTIVGTSNQWDNEYGSLRIQNSWGSSTWGDNGYFWLSVEAYQECGYSISFNTYGEWINGGEIINDTNWTPNNNTKTDDEGDNTGDDITQLVDDIAALGTPAIIGIAIGALVFMILICVLFRCLCGPNKRKVKSQRVTPYQKMTEL